MKRCLAGFILLCLLLNACGPKTGAVEGGPAEIALREFFQALSSGDYAQAARLYGGSYDLLWEMNPSADPEDLAGLWRLGCEVNGLACFPAGRVLDIQNLSEDEKLFVVEFLEKDGSVFTFGPCCGAEENAGSPQIAFEFRVRKFNGSWFVEDMPVLIP